MLKQISTIPSEQIRSKDIISPKGSCTFVALHHQTQSRMTVEQYAKAKGPVYIAIGWFVKL